MTRYYCVYDDALDDEFEALVTSLSGTLEAGSKQLQGGQTSQIASLPVDKAVEFYRVAVSKKILPQLIQG